MSCARKWRRPWTRAGLREHLIVGPRLGDVIHRAILESGAGHVDRTVSGDQDDGKLRIAAVNLLEHVETVAVRQADVEQEKIIRMLFQLLEAGFARFRARDAVAFTSQQEFEAFADFRFVVDYKDGTLRHGPLS